MKKKRTIKELLWGNMAGFDRPMRIASLVFVMAAIASMSFVQLGFFNFGIIDGKLVYLLLLLAPLCMGAVIFGRLTATLLGLFTGCVVYAHAMFFPLDFYEINFMTVLNSFVLFTFFGITASLLFSWALNHARKGAARIAAIVAVSLILSFAASGLVQANTVIFWGPGLEYLSDMLLCSPAGVLVQGLIDAVLIALLSWAADSITHRIAERGTERRLISVFSGWMSAISLVVFMITGGVIFSIATIQAQDEAMEDMTGEIEYLRGQMAKGRVSDLGSLLDGYDSASDGIVAIVDAEGIVLASNDEGAIGEGESIGLLLGTGDDTDIYLAAIAGDAGVSIETRDKYGNRSMGISYAAATESEDGYVVIIRTSDMVYAGRFDVMLFSTLLAVVLILAIALVASRVLNTVVIRHIDEANHSLGKITEGDLNERVRIEDSAEFASLSTGINTTVAALKDSIAEAEQKNAQELATAKAIQESALPREFPAFPDNDRFDLYASMKTAKEVGGDFYDFFLIGESKLGFLIADVSGKGIPAALFMMTAKTQVKTYVESGLPLEEAIAAANHQLCLGNDESMFVTMFACLLDYGTGELVYVNAGHNPPLVHRGGGWEWMRDVSGMPLGLFDGMPYDVFASKLEKGDMLYLYTDGVTEAMDTKGALFGDERLEQVLAAYSEMNSRSVCIGVRRALTEFTLDAEQSDDITMLALRFGVPPEKKAVMVLPAVTTQLVHVHNFIQEELNRRRAPKSAHAPLDIAAEELFVNVCHYAYPDATPENPGEVRIGFEYEANPPSLTITIADDGIAYNPLEKPDAVTPDNIEDVPVGGLGILMAKKSVDEMTYRREGGSNILTFKKSW